VDTTELLEELRRLPMQQSVVTQVLGVLDDPSKSADDVAHALQVDPSLCVRVLHLANSPYFGLSGKVGSVERAVVALGNSVIRSLAVSTAAGLFAERSDHMPAGFWPHSVATAAAASLVAQLSRLPAGDALCAGLLHDLGSALLYRHLPEPVSAVWALPADEVLAAESATFVHDHAALGALALDAWKLPGGIVSAIRDHHLDPDAVESRLSKCVIAAESLARIIAGEFGPALPEPFADPGRALAAVGLPDANVDELLERVGEDSDGLAGLLAAA
jgi:putative nucleotidyltransferase with HDIG domain